LLETIKILDGFIAESYAKLERWRVRLIEYQFKIDYIKGKDRQHLPMHYQELRLMKIIIVKLQKNQYVFEKTNNLY